MDDHDEKESVGWAKRSEPTFETSVGTAQRAPLPTIHAQPYSDALALAPPLDTATSAGRSTRSPIV